MKKSEVGFVFGKEEKFEEKPAVEKAYLKEKSFIVNLSFEID